MPSRGAWGNSRERTKFKRRSPTLSLVQVSPTFLQVCILGTRCWEGDICLKHMHTLRLSAGEKKATCHCDCWFRSSYITNPLLILFGAGRGGNVMQPKLEQECLYQGRLSLLGSKESAKPKNTDYCEMCQGCGAVKNIIFESACCWVAMVFVLFCFNQLSPVAVWHL